MSHDQRQSYKQDFNREYSEYRDLHARIDGVTRQFMELDTQLKQLHHDSHKYKVKRPESYTQFQTFPLFHFLRMTSLICGLGCLAAGISGVDSE